MSILKGNHNIPFDRFILDNGKLLMYISEELITKSRATALIIPYWLSLHQHKTTARTANQTKYAQQSGFATSGWSHKSNTLAGEYTQANIL